MSSEKWVKKVGVTEPVLGMDWVLRKQEVIHNTHRFSKILQDLDAFPVLVSVKCAQKGKVTSILGSFLKIYHWTIPFMKYIVLPKHNLK